MGIKITKTKDNSQKILDNLQASIKDNVLVGVPAEKASRKGEEINNAELAYIMEHGDPMHHIPQRKFLEPTIEAHKQEIIDIQADIVKKALEGKSVAANKKKLGSQVRDWVKEWFTDPRNGWAPNAPSTIKRKLQKKFRRSKKKLNAALAAYDAGQTIYDGDALDTPLIDTGKLIQSISYVIRED